MKGKSDIESTSYRSRFHNFSFQNISYSVNKDTVKLLDDVSGICQGGQMLAIMGPSGAGKSTLLDILAGRKTSSKGRVALNGTREEFDIKQLSSYVEQDDALLGVLTVKETLAFSATLSCPALTKAEVEQRVADAVQGLGLSRVADNRIGTVIQRGISGGQKRRVTIGNAVVKQPSVLFLDEPTSGLDSATAYEVMSLIKKLALQLNMAVIATIHSPNWETFSLFDSVLLLAHGRKVYNGAVADVRYHFDKLGRPTSEHSNPADNMMSIVSTDFGKTNDEEIERLVAACPPVSFDPPIHGAQEEPLDSITSTSLTFKLRLAVYRSSVLTHRNFLNYSRNFLAYGVRSAMYIGMGVLMATVWINLDEDDQHIEDRLSVHFFSVAFLGFMSVAGIPSFLEERTIVLRERRNGLYGALPYVVANTLSTIPFMAICSIIFVVIIYWSIGLHPGSTHFFKYFSFLYLGVLAAEFQSLLIAAIIPIFVASLAVAAFVNGFWMVVQGYFMRNLPAFWYYWAHFIDYETFAFQLLVKNDFTGINFPCQGSLAENTCLCTFPSSLVQEKIQCAVSGTDVISSLGFEGISVTLYAFILVIIILLYRIAFWAVLSVQK